MQLQLRLLPVDPQRLYAYWTAPVEGRLTLSSGEGVLLATVEVGADAQGRFFDLPPGTTEVCATLTAPALGVAVVQALPIRLPGTGRQGSSVVWGRVDAATQPAPPQRGEGFAYLPTRSAAGSHLHGASARVWTPAQVSSPGNGWRRP